MHTEMTYTMKLTRTRVVSDIIDFALTSCSSVIDGNGGTVKMCCSSVVCGWAASVL